MRNVFATAIAIAAIVFGATVASAAELIMFRRAGCPWCTQWDRAIGPVYHKTDIGRRAPVRGVDLDRDVPGGISLLRPVRFSPTFVLVERGRELGRIEGYPGEDFFWGLLEALLDRTITDDRRGSIGIPAS